MNLIKVCAARLPSSWQFELKRIHYARQIKKGAFDTSEPEFKILQKFIKPGDWVIDIGANIGNYTLKFSELSGKNGRVFAFEPVPSTFTLLASNMRYSKYENITLINAAVSDSMKTVGMSMPSFETGLLNFCRAKLTIKHDCDLSVITLQVDSFKFEKKITLVKIDVEDHEAYVINGMRKLIQENLPVIIIETSSESVIQELKSFGYKTENLKDSPNIIFTP